MLKNSLITSLLFIAFQISHAKDSDNTALTSQDTVEQSTANAQNVLPPPSPFFSSAINNYTKPSDKTEKLKLAVLEPKAGTQTIEQNTDVTAENTDGSNDLKSRIGGLEAALKRNQGQANDLVEELHATAKNADFGNEMYEKTVAQLQEKIIRLSNENKTLVMKHTISKSQKDSQQSLLSKSKQDSEELRELKKSYLQRKKEVSSLKKQIEYFEVLREQSNTKDAKVQILEDAYTIISREAEELKKSDMAKKSLITSLQEQTETQKIEIVSLNEKLSSYEQTLAELNDLQSAAAESNDNNLLLEAKIVELDDTNKTLKSQLDKMQQDANEQTRKLGLLDQSTRELMAIKSAYKELEDEKLALSNKFTAAMLDTDKDGVVNELDQCSSSPLGIPVDNVGCPEISDADGDMIPDANDLSPNTSANE